MNDQKGDRPCEGGSVCTQRREGDEDSLGADTREEAHHFCQDVE